MLGGGDGGGPTSWPSFFIRAVVGPTSQPHFFVGAVVGLAVGLSGADGLAIGGVVLTGANNTVGFSGLSLW